MSIGLRLDLKQSQQLVMTPQLQQAIKLLQMSNLQVRGFVEGEVERNPLLRLEDDESSVASRRAGSASGTEPVDHRVTQAGDQGLAAETFDTGAENLYEAAPLVAGADRAQNGTGMGGSVSPGPASLGRGSDGSGYDFDQAPDRPETLREHLLRQLGQVRADRDILLLARLLTEELDAHGLLRTPPEAIAERLGATAEQAATALSLIQGCEPTGVGARSLAECLALQLAERDRLDPAMRCLIDNLDLLELGQTRRLQRLCGVDDDDFADMLAELRRLDPRPCADFEVVRAETLVPDLFLTRGQDGGWQVELNTETLPQVLVDNRYGARLRVAGDGATESFIQGCRADANWLIRSLDQRARTILAVASRIVLHQDQFFTQGVSGLKPLTLADVAEAAELHESTVSRVTSNKYISTGRGIFELKFFFTNAVGGDGATGQSIRDKIRRLIDAEPHDSVLSDDEIVSILQSDGIDIARRTVAKYRKALKIGSSVERRRMKALIAKD